MKLFSNSYSLAWREKGDNLRALLHKFVMILTVILIFSPLTVNAAITSLGNIVNNLQDNYQTMRDYSAAFSQETKIKAYPGVQKSSGKVLYRKPGMMRWNYVKPEKREIVTDGRTVWMYTPSLNQVMKADFSVTSQSMVAQTFLSGMGNLRKDFNVSFAEDPKKGESYRLLLVPKDEREALKSLIVTVDSKTFNIVKTEMTDIYDNITKVVFSDLRINGGLEESIFEFIPPAGVEIVTPPAMQ